MTDPFKERVRYPISLNELNRRHTAVKAAMEQQEIDMLIMSNDNQFLGGYIRYFIDIPASNAYPVTVLFEKNGEITTMTSGPASKPAPFDWAARVITNRMSQPYFRSLDYTNRYDADEIIKICKDKNIKRLGLVGPGMLSYAMISMIKENTGVELVNATKLVDKIKMVKSAEELEYIKLSVKMHEDTIDVVKSVLKPGIYEYELRAELAKMLKIYGSEEQLLLLSSKSGGVPHIMQPFFQNRQIQKGDYVTVLVESSGPGGYYCEMARTYVLGEPSKEAVKAYEVAAEMQRFTASMMNPGVHANTIWGRYNDKLRELDMPIEERLYIHGQGYDLVEMPGFGEEDDTVLSENMFVVIHPSIYLPGSGEHAFCCEDFLITKDGAVMMHKAKQELVICE